MLKITEDSLLLVGPAGQLAVPAHDLILVKLAMLYEGECEGSGPIAAAQKFGYSKQRYFQLRQALEKGGTLALQNQKHGPKTHYRRTDPVIQQVVRYRFLDPDASSPIFPNADMSRNSFTIIKNWAGSRRAPIISTSAMDA